MTAINLLYVKLGDSLQGITMSITYKGNLHYKFRRAFLHKCFFVATDQWWMYFYNVLSTLTGLKGLPCFHCFMCITSFIPQESYKVIFISLIRKLSQREVKTLTQGYTEAGFQSGSRTWLTL